MLFDGTWNDERGGSRTNVHKLWDALEENERQVKHYFRGVGNDEQNGLFWRAVGGFTGIGERRIRRDAYSTLALDHRAGDRLFILGFSRGTASARLLASDLHRVGLRSACASRARASATAARGSGSRSASSPSIPSRRTCVRSTSTSSASGTPWARSACRWRSWGSTSARRRAASFATTRSPRTCATRPTASPSTRPATPFEPTLFNHKPGVVDEVWFAGVHSDVGGGYRRDQDRLGDHTLRYMAAAVRSAAACDHAHAGAPPGDAGCAGTTPLPAEFDEPKLAAYLSGPPDTTLHTHGPGWNKSHRAVRVRHPEEAAPPEASPQIHASALDLVGHDVTFVQRPLRTASRPAPHRELRARPARPARRTARARPVAAIPPRAPPRRRSSSNSEAAETSTTRATPAARARQQALATRACDATDHIVGDHSTPV